MAFIIDPKPQDSVVKIAICTTSCGAKIGYTPKDVIKQEYVRDYGGGGDTYVVLRCPNCSSMITTWK